MKIVEKIKPSFREEKRLWNSGKKYICGVDEVGRGCFAGPVVAAAVIFSSCLSNCTEDKLCLRCNIRELSEINDSKVLTHKKRLELAEFIKENSLAYAITKVEVDVINEIGIGKATQIAFMDSVANLKYTADFILIDAFYITKINKAKQKPIIQGDKKSISIAAASILAKVYRDQLMTELSGNYLNYDFSRNKGYGTKKHREAISKYGLSDLHRTSFDLAKYIPRL